MKQIDVNVDKNIGKQYRLFRMSFNEILNILGDKYINLDYKKFNNEDEYVKGDYDYDWREERHKNLDIKTKISFNSAIENNFIIIHKTEDGNFLIDGFRRLFYNTQTLKLDKEQEIYVKIFDSDTTEQDVMKLMCYANLWKFPQGLDVWIDRGWRLYLYLKTNIMIKSVSEYENEEFVKNHFNALSQYMIFTGSNYEKIIQMFTSTVFYDDLKLIDEVIRKKDLYTTKEKYNKVSEYISDFISILGKTRLDGDYRVFDLQLFYKHIKVEVDEVNRIEDMQVSGWYGKHLYAIVEKLFIIWKDEKKLKIFNEIDETKIIPKVMSCEDYFNSIPEYYKKNYTLKEPRTNLSFSFNGKFIVYKNRKMYFSYSGVCMSEVKMCLVFKEHFVWFADKMYRLGRIDKINEIKYLSGNDGVEFIGTKSQMIEKVKELSGRTWKENKRITEFWVEE